jgi:hypothetical protein
MKVALCLMGIVGSATDKYGLGKSVDYRIGHHFIKKHILDKNDVDVFIHSWSTEFKEGLVNDYAPKKYLIEDQLDFGEKMLRQQSIKSRWYSTQKSIQLKSEHEKENNFEYDFVIVYRFDCMFNRDVIFSEFDNKYFYTSHRRECYNSTCKCEMDANYADLLFFGNSKDMDKFGNLYDYSHVSQPPHMACKTHIYHTGLGSRVKHAFYDGHDHHMVRCKYKDCQFHAGDLDLAKLEQFPDVNIGYDERSEKTPDYIIQRNQK